MERVVLLQSDASWTDERLGADAVETMKTAAGGG
jgi:hypothetical protein